MSQAPGEPTEEELRAYLEQLREADPAQLLVEAYQMLGSGAQVKLGRPDARTLIDAMAGLADAADGKVQGDLVTQMREGVRQLQLAQVQAEQEAGAGPTGAGQDAGAGAAGQDAGQSGGQGAQASPGTQQPPSGAQPGQPQPGQAPGGEQKMTDRLWIPGREPGA